MNRLQPVFDGVLYSLRHPWIKAALVSVLLLAVATGAALGYWWPAHREQHDLIARIETQRRLAIDTLHATDVVRAYQAAKSSVDALTHKLNAADGQADMVKSLERLAAKCHVRIVSQAYEEGKTRNEYVPLYLETGLQASYPSLREFLAELGTLPVWVEVQEMTLERTHEHPGLIKASLRLLTYRKTANHNVARDS